MAALDKRELSERDICSKFITWAIVCSDWKFTAKLEVEEQSVERLPETSVDRMLNGRHAEE